MYSKLVLFVVTAALVIERGDCCAACKAAKAAAAQFAYNSPDCSSLLPSFPPLPAFPPCAPLQLQLPAQPAFASCAPALPLPLPSLPVYAPSLSLPPYAPSYAPSLPPYAPSYAPVSNCGPAPSPLPVIQAPPVSAPVNEGPLVTLPSPPIPAPKTIAHRCICTKTVVKPQVIQRLVSVPSLQKYLRKFFNPVIENIAYQASPNCCEGAPVCPPALPVCAPSCVC